MFSKVKQRKRRKKQQRNKETKRESISENPRKVKIEYIDRFYSSRNLIKIWGNFEFKKGNQLREPYSKHLDDGIFEIPGKVGTDIARVLYFFYYGKKIVMTNGFIKKTQETPKTGNKTGKIISQRLLGKGDR